MTLIFDSGPISVRCHMGDFGCGDGGWTPVMKIDGNKVLDLSGLLASESFTHLLSNDIPHIFTSVLR